jgi:NO-binding membrane sensor protein with MHYT domain
MIDTTKSFAYSYQLVALSVLVAIFAVLQPLHWRHTSPQHPGRARLIWLAGGATAMGTGIWSMYYIGMLAVSLPVPVLYDWPTVLLSLIPAILASVVALF